MIDENTEKKVLCIISDFRYFSNVSGLSLLDSTYLESFITYLLQNKNYVCFEGISPLKELLPVFQMNSVEGVKCVLKRLYDLEALILYQKVGKHHEYKYAFSVNRDYSKLS